MTGNSPWKAQDNVEAVQADTIGAIANIAGFNTLSGCAATYSISDLVVTIASGSITHTGATVAVAGNTVTLVADPTLPRWTYIYLNSSGVPVIISGSPSATPAVPDFGVNVTNQLVYVQAGLTIAGNATYKLDKRVMSANASLYNYKSATQVITTSTAYADVTGANAATFTIQAVAGGVYEVVYYLPLAFGGSGGAKFQITGPASPTNVDITGTYVSGDNAATGNIGVVRAFTAVTSFSADIASFASTTAGAGTSQYTNNTPCFIEIRLRLRNGANAGPVTLQTAQQNSSTTTTLGLGSVMTATRIG